MSLTLSTLIGIVSRMLTQSDLQAIDHILDKRLKKELLPIKTDVSVLKADVSTLKIDIATLKTDVKTLKTDVADLKINVSTLKIDIAVLKTDVAFTKDAVINLLDESQDIHETLVKERLPQRVHRLEHIMHATA